MSFNPIDEIVVTGMEPMANFVMPTFTETVNAITQLGGTGAPGFGSAPLEIDEEEEEDESEAETESTENQVLLFGRPVDTDLLEQAIEDGDVLTYWTYFAENTNSDYARIARDYHDGVADAESSIAYHYSQIWGD